MIKLQCPFPPYPQKNSGKKGGNTRILKADLGQRQTSPLPFQKCSAGNLLFAPNFWKFPMSTMLRAKIPWPPSSLTANFPWSRGGRADVQAWETRIMFLAKFTILSGLGRGFCWWDQTKSCRTWNKYSLSHCFIQFRLIRTSEMVLGLCLSPVCLLKI